MYESVCSVCMSECNFFSKRCWTPLFVAFLIRLGCVIFLFCLRNFQRISCGEEEVDRCCWGFRIRFFFLDYANWRPLKMIMHVRRNYCKKKLVELVGRYWCFWHIIRLSRSDSDSFLNINSLMKRTTFPSWFPTFDLRNDSGFECLQADLVCENIHKIPEFHQTREHSRGFIEGKVLRVERQTAFSLNGYLMVPAFS